MTQTTLRRPAMRSMRVAVLKSVMWTGTGRW